MVEAIALHTECGCDGVMGPIFSPLLRDPRVVIRRFLDICQCMLLCQKSFVAPADGHGFRELLWRVTASFIHGMLLA